MSKKVGIITSFKISGAVPMPAPAGRRSGSKYPYDKLKVGESFLFPAGTKHSTAAGSAYSAGDGRKSFSVRKTPDGIRCWRVT